VDAAIGCLEFGLINAIQDYYWLSCSCHDNSSLEVRNKPITDSVCRCDLKYKAVEYSMMQLLANDTPVPLRPVP